ncbi:T9SS C-terminal target domain-containing protein [Flavobacteriaceae bacterium AU392]|nr:T9SS C-terminal target domain-containing protein [Flavobacteriaceae bacterium]RKM82636.1 T9SS C-terminal target domain-containing protein [Flavobacteriaceae bacterium AU392]
MKKITFCLLFLFVYVAFSQQKSFEIKWDKTITLSTETSTINVPSFDEEHFSYTHNEGLLFIAQWKHNGLIDKNSVLLSNVSYSPISLNELKDVNLNTIPNSIEVHLKTSNARNDSFAFLEVTPIINDNGNYKKVNNFTVNYSTLNRNSLNVSSVNAANNSNAIINSVLNQGDWYRFYVDTTGVFRLTRRFLNDLGVNTNNVNPRTIKIYGQGGEILPLRNSVFYPLDLVENAIQVVGEDDGSFDNEDFILFYAEGPRGFNQENNTNINVFTDRAHYFINISPNNGKRIQPLIEPGGAATTVINTFDEYQFHEIDEFNLVNLGRRWFGNRFDFENDQTFNFSFPNIITSEPIRLRVFTAATGAVPTTMELNVNGNNIDNFTFNAIDDINLAREDAFIGDVTVNSSDISINLNYNNNGNPTSVGYLDYISIEARRQLTYVDSQFGFTNNDIVTQSGIGQYEISNATNISEVWDVTDEHNITSFVNSESNATIQFKAQLGEQRHYIAVDPSDYFEPQRENQSRVDNQNLKGTVFLNGQGEFEDIDYVIITRQDMLSQAERLAQINRERNNLNVKVYLLQDIYNEFSSGNQDAAGIRNFIRYIYNNASSPENRLKYVCLFGEGSFDYKNRIPGNTNVVPSWHTLNSFSLTGSFISDDFFGMMDEDEGTMANSDLLDIAMGRIIAETPQQAEKLVDKVEIYYQEESFGNWRNNYVTISDDVDEPFETVLQGTTDAIADQISASIPSVNVVKIHSDAFQQQSGAAGARYPDVNQAIFDAMEVGALVVNYFGHGGEDGIADERIFDRIDAEEVNNVCRLTCFLTVTCEYTRFDNPLRETAGEILFRNEEAGAITLVTTTRQIFVTVGVSLNVVLRDYLFPANFDDNTTVAEALRLTKTDPRVSRITQRRLVFFIGDPALKLAKPKPNIRITTINDTPIANNTQLLQALSSAKFEGEVVDASGNILNNYNGILTATIYDKDVQRATLGNDGVVVNGQPAILNFTTLGEVIFRGQVSVTNGAFDFNFIVPRDIGIAEGTGKVSLYAKNTNSTEDQAGANFEVRIGGLNENAPEDTEGPTINVFFNDENFVSGGITNEAPTLIAKLFDDSGINTASGIGHDILAILDSDETNPFKLNDFYQTDIDDFQRGTVTFPLRDLEPGLHTLTVIAWDVYNNSSRSEIQFVVHNENEELVIENVLNYPNPFVNYTEFWFNHNSSEVLDVSVQIFTVSGKLVRTINGQTNGDGKSTSSLSRDIVWDGRDDFGDKIGKGVYVYKLTVRSNQLNKQVEKIEKLVIL